MPTKVIFIELSVPRKDRYICDITEKLYDEGRKVEIFTSSQNKALQLSRTLWVWKPEAFIPHSVYFGGADEPDFSEEPVIITTQILSPPADVLILDDPLKPDVVSGFPLIIDFAELYEKQKHVASRQRFKAFRDSAGFEVYFFKLGEFLGHRDLLKIST